jgi:hypothetical protein
VLSCAILELHHGYTTKRFQCFWIVHGKYTSGLIARSVEVMISHPVKITFGEMRASGVTEILIYCRDHRCSHHVEANADGWPDGIRLSDIEPPPPAVTAVAR